MTHKKCFPLYETLLIIIATYFLVLGWQSVLHGLKFPSKLFNACILLLSQIVAVTGKSLTLFQQETLQLFLFLLPQLVIIRILQKQLCLKLLQLIFVLAVKNRSHVKMELNRGGEGGREREGGMEGGGET